MGPIPTNKTKQIELLCLVAFLTFVACVLVRLLSLIFYLLLILLVAYRLGCSHSAYWQFTYFLLIAGRMIVDLLTNVSVR